MAEVNRRFLLMRRPDGMPVPQDFALVEEALAPLPDGHFRVRNHYASLDPAQRGWMSDAPSYMPPIPLGDAVRATTVGIVEESRNPDFAAGDWVLGLNAIEDYSVVAPGGFTSKIDVSLVPSPTNYLSVFGAVGLTAYFGLLDAGQPKPGETVLVSGAAGAVGSLVGQIAKLKGCRTIGIAGGAEKCARLTRSYGYDAAIDYRDKDEAALSAAIAAAAPEGVDIVFENVGGVCLDAALNNLAQNARVILCGLISEYNAPAPVGARNLWQLIVKSARIQGILVRDYLPRFAEGAAEMAGWAQSGALAFDEHIDEGIEHAFDAFMRLFEGSNEGKMILKL
ncbi:NADP-dependent oxidoreductase [Sandaracinobacteroides saxicola]|uniref:NADP-dependent oxidoreductase n=1 Tax=Sandaracinobacteroides saxicola TaxID=2759707 RepID=A0A7G5IEY3_9SPHN|nr:NADP-dependent oxidoreductase [Sandaracinobacteroides saxicola]QMW21925.1 NADP-dependent oxidoreductase [Sandaracinobacteroides saxicola]